MFGSLIVEVINIVSDILMEESMQKAKNFGISHGKIWPKRIYQLLSNISPNKQINKLHTSGTVKGQLLY